MDTMEVFGVELPVRPRSLASSENDRLEQNLLAARESLEGLRKAWGEPQSKAVAEKLGLDSWQAWLCWLPHALANHFGLSQAAVWNSWSRHYGRTLILDHLGMSR